MSDIVNMVDLMLVLAVEFMIFAIRAMGMQSVIFSDASQSPTSHQSSQYQVQHVKQGEQLEQTPETATSSGSGGTEMGKVYKNSNSGKLVMVNK